MFTKSRNGEDKKEEKEFPSVKMESEEIDKQILDHMKFAVKILSENEKKQETYNRDKGLIYSFEFSFHNT